MYVAGRAVVAPQPPNYAGRVRLLVLGLLAFLVLFLIGVVVPRRSHRVQRKLEEKTRAGEERADERAGKLGDATSKSLELFRRGGVRSVKAGRRAREKIEPGRGPDD